MHVLEDEQSGYQSRRQRWLPWPDPTDRTETFGQKLPVNFRRQTHQRMAKVDDLIQRWAKQIVLTIVARLTHGFPPTAKLPSKESRNAEIRNPKTQENRAPPRLSCKIEYLLRSNYTDLSTASKFFTGNSLSGNYRGAVEASSST